MSEDLSDATLYQLVNAFVSAVADGEGEWNETVEALDKAIDGKVERYQRAAHYVCGKRNAILGEAEYYKSLADIYFHRAEAVQAQHDRMEKTLIENMKESGKEVIETPLGTLKIKRTPHVELDGSVDQAALVAALPAIYVRQRPPPEPPPQEVDKRALLNDYRVVFQALRKSMPESDAIAAAQAKMPNGVKIVNVEKLGGF